MDAIDRVLDTPAKRTLWFHIIPLLDEDDQEYTKRRLFLFTGRDEELADLDDEFAMATNLMHLDDDREVENDQSSDTTMIDPRVREAMLRNDRRRWENQKRGG